MSPEGNCSRVILCRFDTSKILITAISNFIQSQSYSSVIKAVKELLLTTITEDIFCLICYLRDLAQIIVSISVILILLKHTGDRRTDFFPHPFF